METKDIKQLQDENKKLKKEYGKLLEELQRLRRFEKETKLPSSDYMKRLQETDLRKKVFEGTNFDIYKGIGEGDSRQFMLYNIEKIIGEQPNCEAAKNYVSQIYGENKQLVDESFPFVPMEDVDGWLLDMVRLMGCLIEQNPWGKCFSLRWLSNGFEAGTGDDPCVFSPENEYLLHWLKVTEYRRIAALVAKMVESITIHEYERISSAVYDYFWEKLHDKKPDYANVDYCNSYISNLLDIINNVNAHIKEGEELGLSVEEVGLIDSLWGDINHHYQKHYFAATKEIWEKIKQVRDNYFVDGYKSREYCQLFVNDMLKVALPIAEKHNLDLELDDEHSLPLSYLKYWLESIYCYDDYRLE